MRHATLLMSVVLLISPVAHADSWNPWANRRTVSPNGEYYVVMKRTGGPRVFGEWGPVEFTICQRGTDTPRVTPTKSRIVEVESDEYAPEQDGQAYEIKADPGVNVRDGDKILGRGTLVRPPLHIVISDAGLGFAGLDVYGYNNAHRDSGRNADHAVIIVARTGKIIHRKRLVDLFSDGELAAFDTSAGGMWWLNDRTPGWIDDAKKQLIVVGATGEAKPDHRLVRLVDWQTGQVTMPIRNSLDAVNHRGIQPAKEIAAANAQAEKRRQVLSNYLKAITLLECASQDIVVPDRPIRAPCATDRRGTLTSQRSRLSTLL